MKFSKIALVEGLNQNIKMCVYKASSNLILSYKRINLPFAFQNKLVLHEETEVGIFKYYRKKFIKKSTKYIYIYIT